MNFEIQGHNLPALVVHLDEGEQILSEVGKMVFKTAGVRWRMAIPGRGIGKLFGMMRRKMVGESALLCRYRGQGTVAFAASFPGSIQSLELNAGQAVIVQYGSFLAATPGVRLGVAVAKRLRSTLWGGEQLLMQRLSGPGQAWIHAAGDLLAFDLAAGETLEVDTGCMVYYEQTVDFSIRFAGGLGTSIWGGEGLFLSKFTGPGRLGLQTMTGADIHRNLVKQPPQ